MLKVKAGEIQHLGILYERYKKRIFGFFYQVHGDVSQSEDMVQNVFMRIMKYKYTYTEKSNFTSWIFQIARNVNVDHFRKHNGKQQHWVSLKASEKVQDQEDIHGNITLSEDLSTLRRALDQLSLDKKEILVLSKLKEMRYREIAAIMDCTEVTARSKVHRALKELKEVFLQLEK